MFAGQRRKERQCTFLYFERGDVTEGRTVMQTQTNTFKEHKEREKEKKERKGQLTGLMGRNRIDITVRLFIV